MRAIILAAGRGSRMKEHTDDAPKCMLRLKNKPLIEHQIDTMHEAGIQQIAVVGGYKKEKISASGISTLFENTRWAETNMVRSLMTSSAWLEAATCIVSYSDIFYSASGVNSLIQSNADIAITYDTHFSQLWSSRFTSPLDDLETFRMNKANILTEIGKRPTNLEEVQGQYMGLLKFTPTGWQQTLNVLASLEEPAIDKLDMTSLLNKIIQAGYPITALPYSDAWGEVDHFSDLALYEKTAS